MFRRCSFIEIDNDHNSCIIFKSINGGDTLYDVDFNFWKKREKKYLLIISPKPEISAFFVSRRCSTCITETSWMHITAFVQRSVYLVLAVQHLLNGGKKERTFFFGSIRIVTVIQLWCNRILLTMSLNLYFSFSFSFQPFAPLFLALCPVGSFAWRANERGAHLKLFQEKNHNFLSFH